MQVLLIVTLLSAATVCASNEKMPTVLYSKRVFCAGEKLRLSCSDDGNMFAKYTIMMVGIEIYTSQDPNERCNATKALSGDPKLCATDYLLETSEYSGLGVQIDAQCDHHSECFIELPSPKKLTSSKVCGGQSYFHSVSVEFTCNEPDPERVDVVKITDSEAYAPFHEAKYTKSPPEYPPTEFPPDYEYYWEEREVEVETEEDPQVQPALPVEVNAASDISRQVLAVMWLCLITLIFV